MVLVVAAGQQAGCSDDHDHERPANDAGDLDAYEANDAASDAATEVTDADDGPFCPDLVEACASDDTTSCLRLFGLPAPNTGLPADACAPTCACADDASTWTSPTYDDGFVASLRAYALVDAPPRLTDDPYAADDPPRESPDAVCAIHLESDGPGTYRLQTWPDAMSASTQGGVVTHSGACGLCSSLRDLAVYIETPDLATPVRECGLLAFREGPDAQLACLLDIGFSEPCADIWFYNTNHTREICAEPCLRLLDAPYHDESGAPNECIQCDEDQSGPIFKAVAGRTRRSSGLPTALCRPCDSVSPISHAWLVARD